LTDYLDLDDLLAAAEAALGGPPDVRDIGFLAGAAARPQASVLGADAYADLDAKAAALLHSIVTSHPLVDGNKRLGWVATRLFYLLNDADIKAPEEAAYQLIVAIADGSVRDVSDIAQRLAGWRAPQAGDAEGGR
jgi:death-on-curing protein